MNEIDSNSEEEIDLSSIVIDKKNKKNEKPQSAVPLQPAAPPPVSNMSNFSIGSVMSVEDLTCALASHPSKLVSLDNKSEFLEAFEEYRRKNGPRTLKSLIDSSLLKVICYGFIDDDPDTVNDEKLLRFLRKGSENREELFKMMNDRVKVDETSTSSIGRVTSLFSSLEKAMMDLGLDSQDRSDGIPYLSEKQQIKLLIAKLPQNFRKYITVSMKFEPPLCTKAQTLKFLLREAKRYPGSWNESNMICAMEEVAKPTSEKEVLDLNQIQKEQASAVEHRALLRGMQLRSGKSLK
jgi:hypothetical protein